MGLNFLELYLLVFVLLALSYSLIAGWSTILYRKKSLGQLRPNEFKVKQGTASLDNRIDVFGRTFFLSIFTYQLHIVAGGITAAIWAMNRFF